MKAFARWANADSDPAANASVRINKRSLWNFSLYSISRNSEMLLPFLEIEIRQQFASNRVISC